MQNEDTVKLLKECNSGVKTAVASIDEVLPDLKNSQMADVLNECRVQHERLGTKARELLAARSETGKEPNPTAKAMSWMKINLKMLQDPSEKTAAGLMIDGCNMGIKSLCGYVNKYQDAEGEAKDIASRLISEEEKLMADLRRYL